MSAFLIELKNKNNELIYKISENITMYNEIIDFINEQNNEQNKENININPILLNYQICIKDQTNSLNCLNLNKKNIINQIQTCCEHTFEYDLIDITPDTSKTIFYCTKCEFTK